MTDFAIKVDDLTKIYPLYNQSIDRLKESLHPFRKKYHQDFYALKNVSFNVEKGETVGIIGQNGSGKSTLLKIITGVLTPSGGSVDVDGRITSLLELGTGFNPDLTGIQNVFFYGSINGLTHDEMGLKLDDILAFADIGEFIHQPVKTYSSGMFVRLAFACAVHIDPEILIVDEALSVGDMRFVQKCIRKMNAFRDDGKTLLLVSHDLGSIQTMSSKVLWLHDGSVRSSGDPRTVLKHYSSFMIYGLDATGNESDSNSISQESRSPTKETEALISTSSAEEKPEHNNENEMVPSGAISARGLLDRVDEKSWVSTEGAESFGEGGVVIKRVAIVDVETGMGKTSVSPGDSIAILAELDKSIDSPNLGLGVLFKDYMGKPMFTINTYVYDFDHLKSESKGIHRAGFAFKWPSVANGKYSLTVAVSDGNQVNHTQLHWVHDAIVLESVVTNLLAMIGTIFFIPMEEVVSI